MRAIGAQWSGTAVWRTPITATVTTRRNPEAVKVSDDTNNLPAEEG
jgi:hypothetical protein